MKRQDEEWCKTQFDVFLRRFFAASEMTWREVPQKDEPPDYYLTLISTEFAVEVTTLVEKVPVGSSSRLPHDEIGHFFQKFLHEVEASAKAENCLHGHYLVFFPTHIDDFSAVKDKIRDDLLEYIRGTTSMERVPEKVVFERFVPQQRPQQCAIRKVSDGLNKVSMGGPTRVKWEDEAASDIFELLFERISTKAEKLGHITVPWILLLADRYRLADQELYKRSIPQLSSLLGSFHTVFVVQGDRRGFILYSQERTWLS